MSFTRQTSLSCNSTMANHCKMFGLEVMLEVHDVDIFLINLYISLILYEKIHSQIEYIW